MARPGFMQSLPGIIGLAAILGLTYICTAAPPNTINPFCTYDLAYRLNVTIEAAGQQYSSTVARQIPLARNWTGCPETRGTALAFRLADNRLVLIGSYICHKARLAIVDTRDDYRFNDVFDRAMHEHRKIDLHAFCAGVSRDQPPEIARSLGSDGFIIDNADHPTRWRGFNFDSASSSAAENLRVVSAIAEVAKVSPEDRLDEIAPAILKTTFKYHGNWSSSPETILSFERRYNPTRHFTYTAEWEPFAR